LTEGFDRIRKGMGVPEKFPAAVLEEAEFVAGRRPEPGRDRSDRRDIQFVTIDPPGSMDLDQAYAAERRNGGYRIHYAIADVGFFVDPGGALEAESFQRGATLYSPDFRSPLYPPVLSEGAASLLPGQDRPAVLWTFKLDSHGTVRSVKVERSIVRSRRRLSYAEAQEEIDSGAPDQALELLKEVGLLRQQIERERGGVDLRIPDQQIENTPHGFQIVYRSDFPVERWNAQMSLMTGIAAGTLMIERGTGLLRTLPSPSDETVRGLRSSAAALGLHWPEDVPYQDFIRGLDPTRPKQAAMLSAAKVLFRGAGYAFFSYQPPDDFCHYAVASPYAHVTAPLRRMADRLCNELLLLGMDKPPEWLLERLQEAPEILKAADKRSRELDSRLVDFVEAHTLNGHLGEIFSGVVVQTGAKGALIQLGSPAVLAKSKGHGYELGQEVSVRLSVADPLEGEVVFEPA
jgi:exoribonuclease R